MRINILYLALFISIFFGCQNSNSSKSVNTATNNYSKLHQANWILGDWTNQSEGGVALEHWEKENDSMYKGFSYFMIGDDTSNMETMSLEQHAEVVTYNPTVRNQNNNKSITFTLTSSSEKQLIFENPNHDFPQKITYTKITSDSLFAEITGSLTEN